MLIQKRFPINKEYNGQLNGLLLIALIALAFSLSQVQAQQTNAVEIRNSSYNPSVINGQVNAVEAQTVGITVATTTDTAQLSQPVAVVPDYSQF